MTAMEMPSQNITPCIDRAEAVIGDIIGTLGKKTYEFSHLRWCSEWTHELIDLMISECTTLCALGGGVEAWYATLTARCGAIINNLYLFQDTLLPAYRTVNCQANLTDQVRELLGEILAELSRDKEAVSSALATEGPIVATPLDQQFAHGAMQKCEEVIKCLKFQTAQAVRVITELSESLDSCAVRLSAPGVCADGTALNVSAAGSRSIPVAAMNRAERRFDYMAEGHVLAHTSRMSDAGERTLEMFTQTGCTIFDNDFMPALTRYTTTHDALVAVFRKRIREVAGFLRGAASTYRAADARAAALVSGTGGRR